MSALLAEDQTAPMPLCVDLDGTLIHTDLLLESLLLLLKRNPLYCLLLPFWLLRGKAAFKEEIARRVSFNPAALPYNAGLISWLHAQRAAGRPLWLCTASNHRLANPVAVHLDIFAGVIASDADRNLSGQTKAAILVEQFGHQAFEYCGNHRVDLPIWAASAGAVVVNGSRALAENAARVTPVSAEFPRRPLSAALVLKALRLHQWTKNVLLLVPLVTAHRMMDGIATSQAVLAFLAFGACASATYLLNDMLDLEADRLHPNKRRRPFASGELGLEVGLLLLPVLLAAAVLLSVSLPPRFWLALGAYMVTTLAYSFLLKRMVLIDTTTLAALYTLRIIAGAAAIAVPLSFWLLLFSIFLFHSLALVKRYAELDAMRRLGVLSAAGRGYHVDDLPSVQTFGIASGYLAVLVLGLYINSADVTALYAHPRYLWPLCVLALYWTSRMWFKAHRGEMHDDPVVFALKDPVSWGLACLGGAVLLAAL